MTKIVKKIKAGHYTYRGHNIKLVPKSDLFPSYWSIVELAYLDDAIAGNGYITLKEAKSCIDRHNSEVLTGCTIGTLA